MAKGHLNLERGAELMTANGSKPFGSLWPALVVASLLCGAAAGHLWGTCVPCYNAFDSDPSGKYKTNKCFMGNCQGDSYQSWCYQEICKACKKGACSVDGTSAFACPAGGNCDGTHPTEHSLCQNSCGC